jgi:hypothetical protein
VSGIPQTIASYRLARNVSFSSSTISAPFFTSRPLLPCGDSSKNWQSAVDPASPFSFFFLFIKRFLTLTKNVTQRQVLSLSRNYFLFLMISSYQTGSQDRKLHKTNNQNAA